MSCTSVVLISHISTFKWKRTLSGFLGAIPWEHIFRRSCQVPLCWIDKGHIGCNVGSRVDQNKHEISNIWNRASAQSTRTCISLKNAPTPSLCWCLDSHFLKSHKFDNLLWSFEGCRPIQAMYFLCIILFYCKRYHSFSCSFSSISTEVPFWYLAIRFLWFDPPFSRDLVMNAESKTIFITLSWNP